MAPRTRDASPVRRARTRAAPVATAAPLARTRPVRRKPLDPSVLTETPSPPRSSSAPAALRERGPLRAAESRPTPRTAKPGPVPEFAPVRAVHVHQLTRDFAPTYFQALAGTLGSRLAVSAAGLEGRNGGMTDPWLLWLRDFRPMVVRDADGRLRMVTSLSTDARRSQYLGQATVPVPPPEPGLQPFRVPGKDVALEWRRVTAMPLLHEPGNFVSDGSLAVVTTKLLEDNAIPRAERHLVTAGYRPRTPDETLATFARSLGLEPEAVLVVPPMPGEVTAHADTFVLAVAPPGRFLVPEVRPEVMPLLASDEERRLAQAVRTHLNEVTRLLLERGVSVDRVPMMPPVALTDDPVRPGARRGLVYTPTNTPLIDAGGERYAHLPTWRPKNRSQAFVALNETYQSAWADYFRANGFTPVLHDATRLGESYGLLRCLTWLEP